MMRMSSQPSERFLTPDNLGAGGFSQSSFNFTPIRPGPPSAQFIPDTVRPVPTSPEFRDHIRLPYGEPLVPGPSQSEISLNRSHKRKPLNGDIMLEHGFINERIDEPQRKVHLTDDFVAQTMSELYIANPKPKVARRDWNRDVAEATNLESLDDLEERFSNQAIHEEYSLPPLRNRKLPTRNRQPQLRLTLHQDLKNLKSTNAIPESLINRYRPNFRQGSTALVLWRPLGGIIPDVITSTWKQSRGRTRSYSEVTNTPYSSHENLIDSESCEQFPISKENLFNHSQISAEAPELSSPSLSEDEIPSGVNLHRRNSAPEISEPLPFLDDGSMEL